MPTVRIITAAPERAAQVALTFVENGFTVQVVSAEDARSTDAEFEIDLDSLPDEILRDPSCLLPGAIVEREFVFAPAWRRFRERAGGVFSAIRPPRTEKPVVRQEPPQPMADQAAPTHSHWKERWEEIAAYSSKTWDANRIRIRELHTKERMGDALTHAKVFGTRTLNGSRKSAVNLWNRSAAIRARANRESAESAVSWVADRWRKPSFSIAAGMFLAFFLGYWAATHPKSVDSAKVEAQAVEASVTSSVIAPATKAAKPSPVRAASVTKPKTADTKRRTVQKREELEEDEEIAEDEVIVRKYPNPGEVAQTPTKRVKRISDLD
jgi:hypothetical protein